MPIKIQANTQHDETESHYNFTTTDPTVDLTHKGGELHGKAKTSVKVAVNSPTRQTSPAGILAAGVLLLAALGAGGALFYTVARDLPWILVPLVVVATLLIVYLFAMVLVPSGKTTDRSFAKLMSSFLRLSLAPLSRRKSGSD